MVAINLRDYLKGIEEMIDAGQVDDALAHCRHVLKTFPKNIDTYRLMGKAYLESKRHSEAGDLFQRVLSSVPDDFVAHIGMSIIREDEGNQDESIWHMERAFESQPSNRAVQDELRRLYGKREGYEPPKVRLTRGALARMYAHGDLYNQAIAELRGALSEDSQRPDLQVLLAEMYFKTNRQAEAIEVCSKLIEKLPYCLYANRVMVDILRNSQRDVEANPYWERVEELDPYAAQVNTVKPIDQVPADTINLEQLQLESQKSVTPPKAWTSSLKMPESGYEKEELPDWLSMDNLEEKLAPEPTPTEKPKKDTSVLGTLYSLDPMPAGEEPETPPVTEPPQALEEKPLASPFTSVSRSTALQADQIPEWLRELRPMTGSLTPELAKADQPEEEEPEAPHWTDELKEAGFKPSGSLNIDDLKVKAKTAPIEQEPVAPAFAEQEEIAEEVEQREEIKTPPMSKEDEDNLSWLEGLAAKQGAAEEELLTTPEERKEAAPEWLASEAKSEPKSEALSWLDDLSAAAAEAPTEKPEVLKAEIASEALDNEDFELNQPATPEPSKKPLPAKNEEPLTWLSELSAAAETPDAKASNEKDVVEVLGDEDIEPNEATVPSQAKKPLPEKNDDSLSWLNEFSQAAGGTPKIEKLSPAPVEPVDESEEFEELNSPMAEAPRVKEPAGDDDTPSWLKTLSAEVEQGTQPLEPIAPRPLEEAPDWLSELRPQTELEAETEPQAPASEPWKQTEDELDKLDWLKSEAPIEEEQPAAPFENTWVPVAELETATSPAAPPEPEPTAVARNTTSLRRRTATLDPEQVEDRLAQARQALSYGNINDAAESYGYLLRRRIKLDEVIADLTAAMRRFPRQVMLWQTLGDAYMRNNQLREALDCYTKAEDLL